MVKAIVKADENLHSDPKAVQTPKCKSVKTLWQRTNNKDQGRQSSDDLLQPREKLFIPGGVGGLVTSANAPLQLWFPATEILIGTRLEKGQVFRFRQTVLLVKSRSICSDWTVAWGGVRIAASFRNYWYVYKKYESILKDSRSTDTWGGQEGRTVLLRPCWANLSPWHPLSQLNNRACSPSPISGSVK